MSQRVRKSLNLLAALVFFLIEVIIRRIKDYRKDRPVIEENMAGTANEKPGIEGERLT